MKRLAVGLGLLAAAGWAMAAYERGFAHFLGIDTQQSQNYDFVSGVGPMFLTAIGMTTIITGLWHGLNCHQEGCWRIGKHKVNGTPWCSRHQHLARPQRTAEELLQDIIDLLMARDAAP